MFGKLYKNISSLGESVSNGKTLVANAITAKGVSTSTSADFATMATNIGKISTWLLCAAITVNGASSNYYRLNILQLNSSRGTQSSNVVTIKSAGKYRFYYQYFGCYVGTGLRYVLNGSTSALYNTNEHGYFDLTLSVGNTLYFEQYCDKTGDSKYRFSGYIVGVLLN